MKPEAINMMAMPEKVNKSKIEQRKTLVCLALSLLMNGLLIGYLMLPHVDPRVQRSAMPPSPPERMAKSIIHSLSPEDAKIVRDSYNQKLELFEADQKNREMTFNMLADVLKQPILDVDALQKALDGISQAHNQLQQNMQALVKQIATQISPQGRAIIAEKGLPPPHDAPHALSAEEVPADQTVP